MFTRDEIVVILDALEGKPVKVAGEKNPVTLKADPQLRAMTLLGLNAGLGVTDCADLRESNINLSAGWLDYPRVKTETPRRALLFWLNQIARGAGGSFTGKERASQWDPADTRVVVISPGSGSDG